MHDVDVEKIDRTHLLNALDVIMSHTVDGLSTVLPGYQAMSKWESPRVMGSHILEEFVPEHIKKKTKVLLQRRWNLLQIKGQFQALRNDISREFSPLNTEYR